MAHHTTHAPPCLLQSYTGAAPSKVQAMVEAAQQEFCSGGGGLVKRVLAALALVGVAAAGEPSLGGLAALGSFSGVRAVPAFTRACRATAVWQRAVQSPGQASLPLFRSTSHVCIPRHAAEDNSAAGAQGEAGGEKEGNSD
jgi:hypothetical protein